MKSGTKSKGVSVSKLFVGALVPSGSLDLTENDGHNDDLNDDGVGWIEPWFDLSRRLLHRKKSIQGAGMIQR